MRALDLEEVAREASGEERGELADALLAKGTRTDAFFIEAIPILPAGLRPLVPLDKGRFATSDQNDLYRRVVNRSNRLRRLLELNAPPIINFNEARMLGEAIGALFDNEASEKPLVGPKGAVLVSLMGRLREHVGRLEGGAAGWLDEAVAAPDRMPRILAHAAFGLR